MRQHEPFRNSELDRAKPKRHTFHSLINDKLKRHRSDTGLVEDRTSSVTIVRIIVGLLMIHLIIIGGVLLRGHMVKEGGAGLATPVSITPPPAPPVARAEAAAQDVLPQPTAPVAVKPAVQANHITQAASEAVEEEVAVDPEEEPVIITPPSAPAAASEPMRHLVEYGDSWLRIAAQYGTTEAALKAANPQAARAVLRAGAVLVIPQPGQTITPAPEQATAAPTAQMAPAPVSAHQQAAAQPAPVAAGKVYTVQRGESLSVIARKTKVSVKTLMEINGIKNANRIYPGMQLRLSR